MTLPLTELTMKTPVNSVAVTALSAQEMETIRGE